MSRKDVFAIRPPFKEGGKDRWVRIGAAFTNRDGSISVLLDAAPLDGKLQIRDYVPKEQGQAQTDFRHKPPADDDESMPF